MMQPEKVATPAMAATPVVQPDNVTGDDVRVIEATDVVTVLPPTSWTVTLGWVVKAMPSTAPAGWVENDSCVAAPMVNVMLEDVAPVRPVEAALSV